eukprot:TRINITY_DN27176_c0_g1_i1.p1 TRINITY_DN27176_c0_g1~~TRINITY_DN27176_c0_g1_i1.p1  ORF type:complete len:272 (-),score=88.82 TRINITY_DN27176_c0_g1_i1:161-976(-)
MFRSVGVRAVSAFAKSIRPAGSSATLIRGAGSQIAASSALMNTKFQYAARLMHGSAQHEHDDECWHSEEPQAPQTARIRHPAPYFEADALVGTNFKRISLADFEGKYVVLLFYPLDFTFVCPTEILAFSDRIDEFRKAGAEVIGLSVDSKFTHLAWANTPRKEGGIQGVSFPLVADLTKTIHRDYDVLDEDDGFGIRGLFIIDKNGVVRVSVKHDRPVGRSVDEALRALNALIFTDTHGDEVCPADWTPGGKTIIADPVKKNKYFGSVAKK